MLNNKNRVLKAVQIITRIQGLSPEDTKAYTDILGELSVDYPGDNQAIKDAIQTTPAIVLSNVGTAGSKSSNAESESLQINGTPVQVVAYSVRESAARIAIICEKFKGVFAIKLPKDEKHLGRFKNCNKVEIVSECSVGDWSVLEYRSENSDIVRYFVNGPSEDQASELPQDLLEQFEPSTSYAKEAPTGVF